MKKLLATILAAAFLSLGLPAAVHAQDAAWPPNYGFKTIIGDRLTVTGTSTNASVDFGLWTRYVKICLQPSLSQEPVYIALATQTSPSLLLSTSDRAGMTYFSTDAASFTDQLRVNSSGNDAGSTCTIGPACTQIHGSAMSFDNIIVNVATPASPTGASSVERYTNCTVQPWRTMGLVMHTSPVATTTPVIMDVWGYPEAFVNQPDL